MRTMLPAPDRRGRRARRRDRRRRPGAPGLRPLLVGLPRSATRPSWRWRPASSSRWPSCSTGSRLVGAICCRCWRPAFLLPAAARPAPGPRLRATVTDPSDLVVVPRCRRCGEWHPVSSDVPAAPRQRLTASRNGASGGPLPERRGRCASAGRPSRRARSVADEEHPWPRTRSSRRGGDRGTGISSCLGRGPGHEVIAIVIVLDLALDLACDDDGAGLSEYAGCVVDAVHPPALARPDGIVDWLEHFGWRRDEAVPLRLPGNIDRCPRGHPLRPRGRRARVRRPSGG